MRDNMQENKVNRAGRDEKKGERSSFIWQKRFNRRRDGWVLPSLKIKKQNNNKKTAKADLVCSFEHLFWLSMAFLPFISNTA